jgi:type II secretory pathway component HofQ
MRKILAGIIVLAFSNSLLAASNGYELAMHLELDGKSVSSPTMIVRAGETASISQNDGNGEIFIEVVASEGSVQSRKVILMAFVVGNVDSEGKRKVLGAPQILAQENKPAKISVEGTSGQPSLDLEVTATRRSL